MRWGLFVLLVTSFGMAQNCPDLNGDYACKQGSTIFSLSVHGEQGLYHVEKNKVAIEYNTDGRFVAIADTENYRNAKYQALCEGGKLVVNFYAELMYDGSFIGKQVSKSEYSKVGQELIIAEKVKVRGIPLPRLRYVCR